MFNICRTGNYRCGYAVERSSCAENIPTLFPSVTLASRPKKKGIRFSYPKWSASRTREMNVLCVHASRRYAYLFALLSHKSRSTQRRSNCAPGTTLASIDVVHVHGYNQDLYGQKRNKTKKKEKETPMLPSQGLPCPTPSPSTPRLTAQTQGRVEASG